MRSSIAPGVRGLAARACAATLCAACAWGLAGFASSSFAQTAPASTAQAGAPADGVRTDPPPMVLPPGPQASPQQSDPRRTSVIANQAARLIREGKQADALTMLESALKDTPRDPQLRFLYGVLAAERGETRSAADIFEQLTQDYPELPEPHNNLAVALAALGDLDRARGALENAVRALPGYALAQENLGDVYLRMAARAYERATQIDPKAAPAKEKLTLARELLARIVPKAKP